VVYREEGGVSSTDEREGELFNLRESSIVERRMHKELLEYAVCMKYGWGPLTIQSVPESKPVNVSSDASCPRNLTESGNSPRKADFPNVPGNAFASFSAAEVK
jgi:hypothetical protein